MYFEQSSTLRVRYCCVDHSEWFTQRYWCMDPSDPQCGRHSASCMRDWYADCSGVRRWAPNVSCAVSCLVYHTHCIAPTVSCVRISHRYHCRHYSQTIFVSAEVYRALNIQSVPSGRAGDALRIIEEWARKINDIIRWSSNIRERILSHNEGVLMMKSIQYKW